MKEAKRRRTTSCVCCSWFTIQKKRLKHFDEDDPICYERDQTKVICCNCNQFQYLVCATDMHKIATTSSIPQQALSQCSWIISMTEILEGKGISNSDCHFMIPKGICCLFSVEFVSDSFPMPSIPDNMDISESEDHIDKILSFRRMFKAEGKDCIDDSKLTFLSCYHHDCNQANSVIQTWKSKNFNLSKRNKRKKGIQYNNVLSGALYLPAFSLLIQSQVCYPFH